MKIRPIYLYVIVSFAFSWIIAAGIYVTGGFTELGNLLTPVLLLYMYGPAVGAIVCVLIHEKGRRLAALGLTQPRWRFMPLAWLGGLVLMVAALAVTVLVPGYELADPVTNLISTLENNPSLSDFERAQSLNAMQMPHMGWIVGLSAVFLGPVINMPLMLSEELGWRGYLWDRLKASGFWRATLITGLLWGVWHMPIIWLGHNYPDAPVIGSVLFILLCLLMSPLYSWLRIKTRSVWGPALLHGTTNATAGYFILLQNPMTQPWQGLLGIGGYIAAAFTGVFVWIVIRRSTPIAPT